MKKKIFVSLLATLMLSSVHLACAQQSAKIPRIGFLTSGSAAGDPAIEAFRQGLRELGYVEGKNVLVDYRYAEEGPQPLSELAEELVRLKVDVIITTSTESSLSAQRATKTIPIVMGAAAILSLQGWLSTWPVPAGTSRE
jgi:putative ABC transport system substrate-binding protein